MSDSDVTVLRCPECGSNRAGILASVPPKAKCADCGHIYPIASLPDPGSGSNGKDKQKRKARPGVRHRRDNGPIELEVEPVPPPLPSELGTLTRYTQEIIEGGPRALIAAQHRAAELSEKFGEEFEAQWCLITPWLKQLDESATSEKAGQSVASDPPEKSCSSYSMTTRNRARVRYALLWRPRFLAVLALSGGPMLAARAAKVSYVVAARQRLADPDFAQQWAQAEEHAFQLLHDVTMRSAIEGDCEPVFWQGIEVGHIRKFDNRLRIEMLRAHMPKTFKTPGSQAPLVSGDNNNVFVLTSEMQDKLIAMRQETLRAMTPKISAPNGAVNSDSGNSPGPVQ
jgi:hypothetical protein